jgi:hypothetical protein
MSGDKSDYTLWAFTNEVKRGGLSHILIDKHAGGVPQV